MINRKFYFFTFAFLCLCLTTSLSHSLGEYTSEEILEANLAELKKSARELTAQNRQIKSATDILEKKIQQLSAELDGLKRSKMKWAAEKQKSQESGAVKAEKANITIELERLNAQFSSLQAKEQALEGKLAARIEEASTKKKNFLELRADIEDLRDRIKELDAKLDEARFNAQNQRLREAVDQSRTRRERAQKDLEIVKKKYEKPAETIAQLKEEQSFLESKEKRANQKLEAEVAYQKTLNNDLAVVEGKNSEQITLLDTQISALSRRKKELIATLEQVEEKLGALKKSVLTSSTSEALLKENLNVIETENIKLRQKLESLEHNFSALTQK